MIAWATRRLARCWNHFDGFAAVSHTSQTQQPISCIACVPLLRIGFFLWVFLCFFQGGISLHFCIVPDSPKVCTSEVWVLWPVRSRALQPWTSWGQFHKLWQWSAGRLSSNQVLPRPSRIWSTSASQNSTSLPLWRNTGLTPPASLWSTIWSLPQSRSSNNKFVATWGNEFSLLIKDSQISCLRNNIRMRAPPTLGAILHEHYDLFKHEVSGPSLFWFVFWQFQHCRLIMAHYTLVFSLCFHIPCVSITPVNVLRMYRGCCRYAPGSTPTRLLGSRCHRAARFTQVSWQRNVAGDSSPYWGNLYDVGPAHDEGTDTTNFEFI